MHKKRFLLVALWALFFKTYGVDAYASPRDAAHVAALHLRDDLKKTGSWDTAVTRYIGGPDTRQWGAVTKAYVKRVNGVDIGGTGATPSGTRRAAPAQRDRPLSSRPLKAGESIYDVLNTDLKTSRERRPTPMPHFRKETEFERNAARVAALTGGQGILIGPKSDTTPNISQEIHAEKMAVSREDPATTTQAQNTARVLALTGGKGILVGPQSDTTPDISQERYDYKMAVSREDKRKSYTTLERFGAAVDQNWFLAAAAKAFDDTHMPVDPKWHDTYIKNWAALEEDAQSQREVEERWEAGSHEEYSAVIARQGHDREMQEIINGSPNAAALNIGASLLGPLGWVVAALAFFALRPAWSQFKLGQQLTQLTNIYQAIEETRLTHFIGAGGGIDSLPIEHQARTVQTITRVSEALRVHPRHVITWELLKNELLAERMGRSIRIAAIERLLKFLIDEDVAMNMDDFAKSYL